MTFWLRHHEGIQRVRDGRPLTRQPCSRLRSSLAARLAGFAASIRRDGGINMRHRYLIKRNSDGAYVGSTDDLGLTLPDGHVHVDTVGEDGLGIVGAKGPGIAPFLKATGHSIRRIAANSVPVAIFLLCFAAVALFGGA